MTRAASGRGGERGRRHSYRVGPYTILVWHGDLAPKLTPQGVPPAAKTVSVTQPGG